MRPGVPWNVKGIEADAREMAQLAARRAGVSLGEWLTQVIMTEGRGGQQQGYMPGDGTYGPMPQPQYQPPLPSLRYPQTFPQPQGYAQPQPQSYPQAYPQAPQHQEHYIGHGRLNHRRTMTVSTISSTTEMMLAATAPPARETMLGIRRASGWASTFTPSPQTTAAAMS